MPFLSDLLPHHPRSAMALEVFLAAAIGILIYLVSASVIRRVLRRSSYALGDILAGCLIPPLRFAFPVAAVALVRIRARIAEPDFTPLSGLDRAIEVAVIGVLTWLIVASTGAVVTYIKRRHPLAVPDNREARRIHTQVTVVGRCVQVVLILLGVGTALLTFPRVQQFGTSILASASIAGIVIGLAARPVLENLIAGIQIGLAQPIRLDDVVIVEGEWGRVEEITLTYIVVRAWDDRRIILPFSKFINEPFQNWTRTSPQITGTVFLHLDYTANIERVRAKAKEIVAALPKWDGRAFALQVTDATERTIQIRVLISAPDAPSSWENRTALREKLIAWLQEEMPAALPKGRLDVTGNAGESATNEP